MNESERQRGELMRRNDVNVISYNIGTFGHSSYGRSLLSGFDQRGPVGGVRFELNFLNEPGPGHFRAKLGFGVFGRRWPWGRQLSEDDHDYFRFRSEWLSSTLLRWRLAPRLVKLPSPDIVHVHTQAIALRLPGWKKLKCPYVISIDNTCALLGRDRPDKIRRSLRQLLALEAEAFRSARHIITWSDRARKSVIEDYQIEAARVTRIYPTASVEFYKQFGSDTHRSTNNQALPRLLFVGNDFRRKGGWDLVEVFTTSLVGRCHLDILSNDKLDLPAVAGLRHLGGLRHGSSKWLACFANADLFVMPTYEDCLPMAFVEAITAGLPVIGTTVMSVPEVVRDRVTGFAIPPGDKAALAQAIEPFLVEPKLLASFSVSARSLAETEFNPVLNNARTADVFLAAARAL